MCVHSQITIHGKRETNTAAFVFQGFQAKDRGAQPEGEDHRKTAGLLIPSGYRLLLTFNWFYMRVILVLQ